MQDVAFMFLRHMSRVKKCTPKWPMLQEFGMQPVQLHWLRLCVRWWNYAIQDDGLVLSALKDQIKAMADGRLDSWVAKFLQAMVELALIPQMHIITTSNFKQHIFDEQAAVDAAMSIYDKIAFNGLHDNPRTCPSTNALGCKYKCWFRDTDNPPSHIYTAMNKEHLQVLLRCRLMNWSIPIHNHNIPRQNRKCHLCHHDIGDEMHFLLHCTASQPIRQRHKHTVRFYTDMNCFMNKQNVHHLPAYVHDIHQLLSEPSRFVPP